MNIEKEFLLVELREQRKLKHFFKKIHKGRDHDPLFEETKYHLLFTDQGYYLKTTIATTATFTRIWRIDLEKHFFFIDDMKYYYQINETE